MFKKIKKKTGKIIYYQQLLGVSIVHPDLKEVIPLAPKMIIVQDGNTKNDCERNAAKRFLEKLRKIEKIYFFIDKIMDLQESFQLILSKRIIVSEFQYFIIP